jgi:hypothetical protein
MLNIMLEVFGTLALVGPVGDEAVPASLVDMELQSIDRAKGIHAL